MLSLIKFRTFGLLALLAIIGILWLNLASTKKDLALCKEKNNVCLLKMQDLKNVIDAQNKAILQIKKEIKTRAIKRRVQTKYKKIFVKDNSCKGELNAYKELFNAFNK